MAKTNIDIVLDCEDPVALAEFWAEALGYEKLGFKEPYFFLRAPERAHPPLLLQRVPEQKNGKNRMHIDIKASDVDAEAVRLEGLGAKRLQEGSGFGMRWVTMADPEGNEFCVCKDD